MNGTLVCGVTDNDQGHRALQLGVELSERLGLRLVLAHVAEGIGASDDGDGSESVTTKGSRQGAERRLAQLADDFGVADTAERRVAVGDPAALLGQIASEEAADVIVVGARSRGWRRRRLESRLADELGTETPVPVLIAAPRAPRVRQRTVTNRGRR